MMKTAHTLAIEAALAADWTRAHEIVQELDDPLACWVHAILHKMEGDASNSRYWYSRAGGGGDTRILPTHAPSSQPHSHWRVTAKSLNEWRQRQRRQGAPRSASRR